MRKQYYTLINGYVRMSELNWGNQFLGNLFFFEVTNDKVFLEPTNPNFFDFEFCQKIVDETLKHSPEYTGYGVFGNGKLFLFTSFNEDKNVVTHKFNFEYKNNNIRISEIGNKFDDFEDVKWDVMGESILGCDSMNEFDEIHNVSFK